MAGIKSSPVSVTHSRILPFLCLRIAPPPLFVRAGYAPAICRDTKKEEHPQTRMLPIDSNNKIIRRRSAERG